MKTKLTVLILIFSLTGCVTETRYSSFMYGNNLNTATGDGAEGAFGDINGQCSDCSIKTPIIRPAR